MTDNETETQGDDEGPWTLIMEETMQNHRMAFEKMKMSLIHSDLDEQSAIEKLRQIFL